MTSSNTREKHPPHVMVQFGDGAHSFLLPAGATLMELADRVDDLAATHESAPIAIHVDFNTLNSGRSKEPRAHSAYH